MTVVEYAKVTSVQTSDDVCENTNQIQLIDSDDEENLPLADFTSGFANVKKSSMRGNIITTGLLILCYFTLSIGLTFYQRWLLKV